MDLKNSQGDYRPRLPRTWENLIETMKAMPFDQLEQIISIVEAQNQPKDVTIFRKAESLDELFERFNLVREEWTVIDSKINQWTTTMNIDGEVIQVANPQISARIRPVIDMSTPQKVLKRLENMYLESAPVRKARPKNNYKRGRTLEVMITDHHLGKLPVDGEYSLETAGELYMDVVEQIVERCQNERIERILYVMGNDFLHVDNPNQTTTSGTQMEANALWAQIFEYGAELQVRAIDRLSELAPVEVIPVPGNHDYASVVSLGFLLRAWYRNDENVSVRKPKPFQYWFDGTTLIGWTHGNIKADRLPLIMAKEMGEFFQHSKISEWHIGHLHHAKSKRHKIDEVDEEAGVVIKVFPALCPADSYHQKHGWHLSARKSTAILWETGYGQAAEYSIIPESFKS